MSSAWAVCHFFSSLWKQLLAFSPIFYYRPTVEYAYQDMKDLEFTVTFGLFLRNMHRWAAHGMVLINPSHVQGILYRFI